jgi:hypothetical protein
MDQDELVNKRVHAIARAQDCTIDQVNAALDQHPIELDRDRFLKQHAGDGIDAAGSAGDGLRGQGS